MSLPSWQTSSLDDHVESGLKNRLFAWRAFKLYGSAFQAVPMGLQQALDAINDPITIYGSFRNEPAGLTVSRSDLNNLFRMAFPFAEWADIPEDKQREAIFDLLSSLPRKVSNASDLGKEISISAIRPRCHGNGVCSFMLRSGDFVFPVVIETSEKLTRTIDAVVSRWPKEINRGLLRFLFRVCYGYAILSKDELRSIEWGDVIEIDGPDRYGKKISLILAESHVLSEISLDEDNALSGFRHINGSVFGRFLMDFNEATEDDSIIVDEIGSLKLTLVFEAGRKLVTLEELESMSSGDLIQLIKPQETVDILVGRQKIGEGELVAIDGGFGVRVSSLVGS